MSNYPGACNCGRRWDSSAQAHCPTCHRHFGGIKGFYMHRKNGTCVDPVTLGLELRDGIWRRTDLGNTARDYGKAKRHALRAARIAKDHADMVAADSFVARVHAHQAAIDAGIVDH